MTTETLPVPDLARTFPFRYAVVDVETTGLSPRRDRVLSVAVVRLRADGTVEDRWSTLLNPGCDPGPVHIHGLTRERLAGSPTFDQILETLSSLLAGRVLVAHNAVFDWQMLASEALRIGQRLAVEHRLCTRVLSKRLDLPLPNLKLGTLASHWGVVQTQAHDAADDAHVLAVMLPELLRLAAEEGMDLPLTGCAGPVAPPFPPYSPKVRCAYLNPGPFAGAGLVQGMRLAVTGETVEPRESLVARATRAGLDVTGSVSRRTSVLVTNNAASGSGKARAAAQYGTPVLDEPTFLRLLEDVRPGRPRDPAGGAEKIANAAAALESGRTVTVARRTTVPGDAAVPGHTAAPEHTAVPGHTGVPESSVTVSAVPAEVRISVATAATLPPERVPSPATLPRQPRPVARPFGVRRVLVLGGPHEQAVLIRDRVVEAGGIAAVNLTASVTDVVCLDGGEQDRRMPRIRLLELPVTTATAFLRHLDELTVLRSADPPGATTNGRGLLAGGTTSSSSPDPAGRMLVRGAVEDLPTVAAGRRWSVAATWAWGSTVEVDLVAFLLGEDEQVGGEEDFVFFNQPQTPDGAVTLTVDGPAEQAIGIDLAALPGSVQRVALAAALTGGQTFRDVGPIGITAHTPDGKVWLHATLDAATTENTLVLAEIYLRRGTWRFRAVGQGYDHGLSDLARSYGVDTTD